MTDFLSGLLDRALERAPMLQRRQPALFERTARAPQLNLLQREGVSESALKEVDSVRENAHGQDARHSHTAPPKPPYIEVRPLRSPAPESEGEKMIRWSKSVAPIEPSENNGKHTTGQPSEPALPKPLVPPVALAWPRLNRIIPEVTVEKSAPSLALPLPPAPRHDKPGVEFASVIPIVPARITTALTAPSEDRDVKVNSAALAPGHAHEPAPFKPVMPTMQPTFAPLPRPVLPARRSSSETTRQVAPLAPTVQVTIGRLEVRAAPPAAPTTRAARPAGPKLNLEDYLRSRSGGGQ